MTITLDRPPPAPPIDPPDNHGGGGFGGGNEPEEPLEPALSVWLRAAFYVFLVVLVLITIGIGFTHPEFYAEIPLQHPIMYL